MRNISRLTSFGLVVFLLFPFVFLILKLNAISIVDHEEVSWALKNSTLQAAGSASLALILGFIFFSGIVKIKEILGIKIFRWIEILCLIPGMLPSLFTILILMSLIHPFPMGLKGIILIHGIIYSGFIALNIYQLVQDKAQSLVEVAYILGASRTQIFVQIFRLLKWELISLWILIFSICFTSFAVPLTVGGGWGTTLEVLIFEKIRLSAAWSQALSLALLQSVLLFLFSFIQRPGAALEVGRYSQVPILGGFTSGLLLIFSLLAYYGTFLLYSFRGWTQFFQLSEIVGSTLQTVPQTLIVGVSCGAMIYMMLNLTAFGWKQKWLRRFLIGFVAPSTSLAGLIVVLLRPDYFWMQIGFFTLAFVTIVFGGLYRMGFDQRLTSLKMQIEVAQVLGAHHWLIFREVIWPQIHPMAARLAGIASLWMVGDFALSRVIFSQDIVLAQVVQGLINSYHLDIGMAVMNVVILIGLALYFLFEGFGRVFSYKTP